MGHKLKVVVTDYEYETLKWEREQVEAVGAGLVACQCNSEEELIENGKDADALLVQYASISRKVMENLGRCQVIVRYGVGVDNIDIESATDYGIAVVNVPDYGLNEVADHTMALLLASSRKLLQFDKSVKQGTWNYRIAQPLYRINGKKLGLIAFGNIARLVAARAQAFGMDVQVYDPFLPEEIALQHGVRMSTFDDLIQNADYISVHCPANASNYHLFNRDVFAKMKKHAIFINTARGALVEENDLAEALEKGIIGGAGIDVCKTEPLSSDSRLLNLENIIITPHAAWYTEEAQQALQVKAGQEIARALSGEMPLHVVNPQYINHSRINLQLIRRI